GQDHTQALEFAVWRECHASGGAEAGRAASSSACRRVLETGCAVPRTACLGSACGCHASQSDGLPRPSPATRPLSPPQLFDSHPLGTSTVQIPKVEQGTRALDSPGWGPARWLPRSRGCGSLSLCFLNCGGRRSAAASYLPSYAALLAGQACTTMTAAFVINQLFGTERSRPQKD
ncbi:hypothetical protein CMEL01_11291, partial [Colletotrichum melonis]